MLGFMRIDTDAAKGGHLTAVIFPGCKVVQVSLKKNYYEESCQEWSKIELSENSPARANYFITVRARVPSANQRLINMVLSPKEFEIDIFLKLFEGTNLQAAFEALKVIQVEIETSSSGEN